MDYCKLTTWPLQAGCHRETDSLHYEVNQLSLGLHRLLKVVINHNVSVSLLHAVAMELEAEIEN